MEKGTTLVKRGMAQMQRAASLWMLQTLNKQKLLRQPALSL